MRNKQTQIGTEKANVLQLICNYCYIIMIIRMTPTIMINIRGVTDIITLMTSDFCNSIQLFIIYVPSQEPQGQLQTQHSADIHNYIMGRVNIE
jgi:hypothetical protein